METEDEKTNMEVQRPIEKPIQELVLDPTKSSKYEREGNVDDVDQRIHDTPSVSPRRDASMKSNIEETSNLDVTVKTSNVDKHIMNSKTPSTSTAKLDTVIPPESPTTSPIWRRIYIYLDITKNISNNDSNVNMGETSLKDTSTGSPP